MVSNYEPDREDDRDQPPRPRLDGLSQEPVNYNHLSNTALSHDLNGYVKSHRDRASPISDARSSTSDRSAGSVSNASSSSSRPTSRQSLNSISLDGRSEPWHLQFERLRDRLEGAQSREEKLAAMGAFVQSLPPFYAEAARYMVTSGEPVNVDSLYHYFTKLDKTSSAATVSTTSLSSSRRSSSSQSEPRPLGKTRKVNALEHDFGGFSPSRPQIANLLVREKREQANAAGKDISSLATTPTKTDTTLETGGGNDTTST